MVGYADTLGHGGEGGLGAEHVLTEPAGEEVEGRAAPHNQRRHATLAAALEHFFELLYGVMEMSKKK